MRAATTLKLSGGDMIHIIAERTQRNPMQLDLFADTDDKSIWLRAALAVALKMPSPFWWTELRTIVSDEPPCSNWWAALTKKMKASGFAQTGNHRKSLRESRKGGKDWEWKRNENHAS